MAIFQGVIFLFFGVGLLLVSYRSLATGWLPCGPNGFKGRLEVKRVEQPIGFWLLFMLYAVAGLGLTIFALYVLTGKAAPLPLR